VGILPTAEVESIVRFVKDDLGELQDARGIARCMVLLYPHFVSAEPWGPQKSRCVTGSKGSSELDELVQKHY